MQQLIVKSAALCNTGFTNINQMIGISGVKHIHSGLKEDHTRCIFTLSVYIFIRPEINLHSLSVCVILSCF